MNVLDMLQAYLAQNVGGQQQGGRGGNLNELFQMEMGRGPSSPDPILPSYLPDAVRRSILEQSSYGEGEKMPPRYRAVEQEFPSMSAPQRDAALDAALGRSRVPDRIMSDSNAWLRNYYDPSNNGYPDPLNSMMGRYPLALY